jgi:hypothetical protein
MAILDFLIVCVHSQAALLGYLCDMSNAAAATFGSASILPSVVDLLRWSTQVDALHLIEMCRWNLSFYYRIVHVNNFDFFRYVSD